MRAAPGIGLLRFRPAYGQHFLTGAAGQSQCATGVERYALGRLQRLEASQYGLLLGVQGKDFGGIGRCAHGQAGFIIVMGQRRAGVIGKPRPV